MYFRNNFLLKNVCKNVVHASAQYKYFHLSINLRNILVDKITKQCNLRLKNCLQIVLGNLLVNWALINKVLLKKSLIALQFDFLGMKNQQIKSANLLIPQVFLFVRRCGAADTWLARASGGSGAVPRDAGWRRGWSWMRRIPLTDIYGGRSIRHTRRLPTRPQKQTRAPEFALDGWMDGCGTAAAVINDWSDAHTSRIIIFMRRLWPTLIKPPANFCCPRSACAEIWYDLISGGKNLIKSARQPLIKRYMRFAEVAKFFAGFSICGSLRLLKAFGFLY